MVITFSSPATNDANNFYNWAHPLSRAIANVGLVQTADSGQIVWASSLTPTITGSDQVVGYEIFRFGDALQATAPIFMKFEYGGGTTNTFPALWFTAATATYGNGTLTGLTTARVKIGASVSNASSFPSAICGDTNRLAFALFQGSLSGATPHSMVLNIERTHINSGVDSNAGFICMHSTTNSTSWKQYYFDFTAGQGVIEPSIGALTPAGSSASSGTSIAVFPIFTQKGSFLNPFMNMLVYANLNITVGVPISFTLYGALRTYVGLGVSARGVSERGTVGAWSLLMRNE